PAGHPKPAGDCVTCHAAVIDASGAFVDAAKHVDGVVELGKGEGCASCHGQPPATGAHRAHVQAEHHIAAPVPCAECHTVPASIDAPGHLDRPAQVVMASAGGRTSAWDAASGTCGNVYCHGAIDPSWSWGSEAIGCGTCHSAPPPFAPHTP